MRAAKNGSCVRYGNRQLQVVKPVSLLWGDADIEDNCSISFLLDNLLISSKFRDNAGGSLIVLKDTEFAVDD